MAADSEIYLFIHLKSFPIGICWFTQPGEQEKKNVEKEPCPMGSDEIHEILSIKSHEIQWDLMRFMRF
jgi:hypothetical protein